MNGHFPLLFVCSPEGNIGVENPILCHGSLNVPIEHHPTIRYMVYNGYCKVMSFIFPKWDIYQPLFVDHHIMSLGKPPGTLPLGVPGSRGFGTSSCHSRHRCRTRPGKKCLWQLGIRELNGSSMFIYNYHTPRTRFTLWYILYIYIYLCVFSPFQEFSIFVIPTWLSLGAAVCRESEILQSGLSGIGQRTTR